MTPEISRVIHRTSAAAAAVAAVLSPVPMADEVVLLPVFGYLATRIGRAHGLAVRELPWSPLARTAATGLVARATLNLAVAFIPGVAAVANASSAAALTEWFGRYADRACADPANATPAPMGEIFAQLRSALGARRGGKPAATAAA